MIDINGLAFSYRDRRLQLLPAFGLQVDKFVIAQGTSTALVGPSGSGKTTLLGLIAGTLKASAGTISVNQLSITEFNDDELSRYRIRDVGQVFQAFELLDYLTVIENVMLPWFIASAGSKAEIRKRAEELLVSVGLASKFASRPGELSQGEQQRVAVCRALLNKPAILLADEPTGNLDQENKQNVVDLLCQQASRNNSTLLMVTHDESLLGSFDAVLDMRTVARPLNSEKKL